MHFIYSLINLYIHECNCPFNFCHCLYIYTRLGKKNTKKTCCLIVLRTIWLLYIHGRGHPQCFLSNPAPLYTVGVIDTESHTFRTTTI